MFVHLKIEDIITYSILFSYYLCHYYEKELTDIYHSLNNLYDTAEGTSKPKLKKKL